MTQRRSLSESLPMAELSPEAWAIIKQGSPQPAVESRTPLEVAKPKPPPPKPVREPAAEPEGEETKARGLVPLSVRVQAELADTLLKVAFDRKLQRKAPFSQQDIVTQAVTQWLRRGGYLS